MDIIIGAGVTGLSYVLFCKHKDFLLLEQEEEIGGYCRTICQDDFVWDYSGHFFHFQNPEIKDIIYQGMETSNLVEVVKSTKIYYKGKMIDFPFQKNIHQLDKEDFIDCLYDLFMASQTTPTVFGSFKQMLYAALGKGIAERFLIPYNEKLYACDLDSLDAEAMGRFFPKADLMDIISNFKSSQNSSYNSTFTYSRKGAIDYVNSLATQAGLSPENLHTGEKVLEINTKDKILTTQKGSYHYDRLISSMPFDQLLKACHIDTSPHTYTFNKVLVFNLGFNTKGQNTQDHWIYFPQKEIVFYRVGFYDNILGTDRMSLYIEIGFKADEVVPDEDLLLAQVLQDLKKVGIMDASQELVSHASVLMSPAYVHINPKATADTIAHKKELQKKDIFSVGRYGSWTYCSIEDNIIEARDLAHQLNPKK